MKENKETINIQLRSEVVQDILSRPPRWMVKWGNSVIFVIIVISLLLCYLIKYPDVIPGSAIISTQIPPVYITSNVNGRIENVIVENGGEVNTGDVLMEIENPVSREAISYLESYLDWSENHISTGIKESFDYQEVALFEAQLDYLELKNAIETYDQIVFGEDTKLKVTELKNKLGQHQKIKTITLNEAALSEKESGFARERFEMEEKEYNLGFSTKLDYLNAQSTYNQSLKTQQTLEKNIIQIDLTLEGYNNQLRELAAANRDALMASRATVTRNVSALRNFITRWKSDFTIKSPTDGKIDYLQRVKEKQQVKAGQPFLAVIPSGSSYEVQVMVPAAGFGKVKSGQSVKLKLDNYPFQQFGTLDAHVVGVSALPKEDSYTVTVALANGLKTNYDQAITYSPEMTGQAEIVTDDLRLIERFFHQLTSLLDRSPGPQPD